MNIDDLTLGQMKEINKMSSLLSGTCGLNSMLGRKVIIRTYSAGVWFGALSQKSGNEVILTDARRMWRWFPVSGISLSEVSLYGLVHEKSKICPAVPEIWLESIEIMPCSDQSIKSIEGAEDVKAI